MLLENIKRVNELEKLISHTKTQIEKWENVQSISADLTATFPSSMNGYSQISTKHIPLNVIRAVSLEGFKKDLADYEAELAAL